MAEDRNGSKSAITTIVGLFAVISGVYAMMEPMGQRIDFLTQELNKLSIHLDSISERERGNHALIKTLEVRLINLEKDMDNSQSWMSNHDLRIQKLNATQSEKIKSLEREMFKNK